MLKLKNLHLSHLLQSLGLCELEPQSVLGGPSEDLSAGSTVGRDGPVLKKGRNNVATQSSPYPRLTLHRQSQRALRIKY